MSFLNAQNFSCGTDFTYTNSGGLTVDFKGSAIGEVSYYAWDFGDSTFVQGDIFISHTYATDGVYNVCLIGYDSLWNYCMGRNVLTGQNQTESLQFLKAHDANYLLIVYDDIGKFTAFSSIGSDKDYDRYSWMVNFEMDSTQTQETRNETRNT